MPIKLARATIVMLVACLLGFGCFPVAAQNYLTDLGQVSVLALNNNGQVLLPNAIYSNGTFSPLPSTIVGGAINDSGVVAGQSTPGSAICINGGCFAAYSGGVVTIYPVAGQSTGINDSDTIVGFNYGGQNLEIINGTVSGIIGTGKPWAINNSDQILMNSIPGDFSAVIDANGTTFTFQGQGLAINAGGTVAGTFAQAGVLFMPGTSGYQQVILPQATTVTTLNSINDGGLAVGQGEGGSNGHAFLYNGDGDVISDVNNFIAPSDPLKPYVTLVNGVGINNSGLVLAYGDDSRTGQQHAYLLQVPLIQVGPCCFVYDFPTTAVGTTSAPQTATFTNDGPSSVALGGVSSSASFNIQSNSCGASLAPSASCSVSIAFIPTAAGTASGNLTLLAAGLPLNVPESGTALLSVSIQASPNPVLAGTPFTVTWNATPGAACEVNGSMLPPAPPGWSDPLPSSGSKTFTSSIGPNEFIFGITCSANGDGSQSAFVTVNVNPTVGTVNFTASPTTVSSGQPITLTWTSQNQTLGCLGSGGGPSDGWNGAQLPANGSRTITEPLDVVTGQSETLTFSISCYSASGSGANASVKVVQLDSPAPASHGGGALDFSWLAFLTGLLTARQLRRMPRRTTKV